MRLVTLIEEGWSVRRVADRFGVPKSTVQDIKMKWYQTHSLERTLGTGRKKISTEQQDNNLVRFLEANPFKTAVSAKEETGFPGCYRTAQKRVKQCSNLENHPAAKKPYLTATNKESRVGFALEFYGVEPNFWRNVIFTDEKVFQSSYNGRVRVYRPPNTRFDERYTQNVANSGRFSVNVWGWMSYHGIGICTRILERFNAETYINILETIMMPSVNAVFHNNFIYQHDNCPVHSARVVTNWLQQRNIQTLPWPSRSPDLNVMENVWGYLVNKINKFQDFRPQNADELWRRIEEAWQEITPEHTHNLVASLPRRLVSVIEKNGSMTKY